MTTAILRGYGAEIYGFLVSTHGGWSEADDVFSAFSEALWRSVAAFDLRCSARTWAYRIARNTSVDHRRGARRRREVPMTSSAHVTELAQGIRTATASYLKTERKTELQRLRDELDPDDRALLVLRIDRDLGWSDLARIFLQDRSDASGQGCGVVPEADELKRESARLRQRFQKIKRTLHELGRERGLVHG